MTQKRRWTDEIRLVGDTRGFIGGMASASFALNQVGMAVGAVARGLAAPVNAAHAFQVSLNQVAAVSQATTAQMSALEAQALDMGASTKFSATEAADAQSFLAMAGLSVQQTMSALPATLALAAAGNLELADAADIATNVLSGYGLATSDLARVTDVIATTAASANTNVQQVGQAMAYVGPVAAAAGLQVEETAAAIGLLGNAGLQGEMGGTALRGAITKLLAPSKEAADVMAQLGVTATDTSGEMLPLRDVIAQFEGVGLTAGDAMTIFGQRAGPGLLALVSQGSGALSTLTTKLDESGGAAQRMADVQQQGLVGAMTNASSAASNLQIIIGQALTPAVSAALVAFTSSARALGEWVRSSDTARVASQGFGTAVAFVAGNAGALTRVAVLLTAAYLAQRNQAVVLRTATVAWGGAVGLARGVASAYRLVVVSTTAAMGLYRAGLLGARAAMLGKAAAVGVARVAMIALRGAIAATGIGALVLLVGTGLAVAWAKWGGAVQGFLAGVWNRFVGAIEVGMGWIQPLAEWAGIKLPASLDTLKFTLDGTGQGLERYADTLEGAYEQHGRATAGIRAMEAAGQEVDPKLRNWTAGLERHIETLGGTVEETDAAADAMAGLGPEVDGAAGSFAEFDRAVVGAGAGVEAFNLAAATVPPVLMKAQTAAEQAQIAFDDWFASVQQSAPLAVGVEFPDAGRLQGGLDLVMGMLEPPASVREALGPTIGQRMLEGLQSTWTPQNVSAIFARAFTGGGGVEGAFKALGAQAGGHISEGLQGFLAKNGDKFGGMFGGMLKGVIGMAIPIIGPALGSLAGWIGGKLFGGPSKEVQAARQSMDQYAASIEDMIGQSQGSIDRYQDWLSAGFTKSHATIVTHFQDLALANGEASQAGVDLWTRYQAAVEDGNQAAIDAVMAQIEAWGGSKEAMDAATAAAAEHAAAMEGVKAQLMGLPTKETVADFELLRETWDAMNPDERAAGFERYIEALTEAREAGIELTEQEQEALEAFEALQEQIDATTERQAAELEALQQRQSAELDALADARTAKLDILADGQRAALEQLRAAQEAELAELRAAQEAELAELRAGRQAALGVLESAIQRELEEERIRVRLRLDLQAAGNDAELQAAARKRAAEAEGRLADSRAMSAAMEAAEERIRARHQKELDEINASWDKKEAVAEARHETEIGDVEKHHENLITEEKEWWAESIAEWTHHFDQERLPALQAAHAKELTELEAAHASQLAEIKANSDAVVAEVASMAARAAAEAVSPPPIVITTIHETVYRGGSAGVGGAPASGGAGGSTWTPYGGERAMGGPVAPGVGYLVGEHRPELFVPDVPGRIEPRPAAGPTEIRLSADDALELIAGRLVRIMPREEARLAR